MGIISVIQDIFKSWRFDPLTATIGFWIPITLYTYYEVKDGKSSYSNLGQFFYASSDAATNDHGAVMSLIAYWIGVGLFVQVVPKPGGEHSEIPYGLPNSLESFGFLVAEVTTGIILYDAIFFFVHWSMHECKALRFLSHKEHHRKKFVEARHVLTHSLFDGSMQVLVNICVQRYTFWGSTKTRTARALHNLILTWMLTESHTCTSSLNIFRKWARGVREHRQHHLGHISHDKLRYQQLFSYLDDARFFVHSIEFGWETKHPLKRMSW